jgi:hypothetical protein
MNAAVPAGFDEWFARAVHRDPEERFQSAEELAGSLVDLCDTAARSLRVPPNPVPKLCLYFVSDGDVTVGPVDGPLLLKGFDAGRVPEGTRVWTEGWPRWRPAAEVADELRLEFGCGHDTLEVPIALLREEPGLEALAGRSMFPPMAPAIQYSRGPSVPVFYLTDGTTTVGPVRSSKLRRGVDAGEVAADTLVWRDGWSEWRSLQSALEGIVELGPEDLEDVVEGHGLEAIGPRSMLPPAAPVPVLEPACYVVDGDLTVGPIPLTGLREALADGLLPASALVWREGTGAWRTVGELRIELNVSLSHAVASPGKVVALGPVSILPPAAPPRLR